MAETALAVIFRGAEVESGHMPVRDLAPALLAFGEVFTEASVVLYPDRSPVALSIRATDRGSFEVHLILEAKKTWDQIVDIFGSDGATAIVNLKELVIGGAFGLFVFIKKLRSRRVTRRERAPDPGMIRLTLDDGDVLEVPADVLRLYDRLSIRKNVRNVLEPLARDGIDEVAFRSESEVTISAAELPDFEPGDDETPVAEEIGERVLQIAAVTFIEGNKWRLTDGVSTFWSAIEDEGFLARVEQGEPFSKGDMLRARVRIVQTQDAEGNLKAEYVIERVIEHIRRTPQLRLDEPPGSEPPRP